MTTVTSFDRNSHDELRLAQYKYIGPMERASVEFLSGDARKSVRSTWALAGNRSETIELLSARLELGSTARLAASPVWDRSDISAFVDERNNLVHFRRSEIVVGFRRRSAVDVASISLQFGLKIKWFDRIGNYGLFSLPGENVDNLLGRLRFSPMVQYAHPNVLIGSDDLDFSDLESDGVELPDKPLWNHEVLLRSDGWSSKDGSGVIICIVDTGIYIDHSGFAGQLIDRNTILNFGESEPLPNPHGTSVASIAIDKTITRFGHTVGLAPAAKLMPLIIDTSAMSSYVGRARAINFIAKVASERVFTLSDGSRFPVPRVVVNCSWKVEGTQDLSAVRLAFAALVNSGSLCVCSAGNASTDAVHYPSDYPGCISVSGLTKDLVKSKSSNFGNAVGFAMPGGDGTPFDSRDILAAQGCDLFDYTSGTSFAAPHASALLAVHWSRNPELSAKELQSLVASKYTISVNSQNPTLVGKLGAGLICFSR